MIKLEIEALQKLNRKIFRFFSVFLAASRLTPISASMNGINLRHSPTSSLASSPLSPPATSQLHSPLAASSTTLASVESLEPDQLIATLHRSPTNGNLFGLLRKKLQSKSPTDKWLDAFCKADGIHFLLEAWKSNREKPLQKLSDAYFQRECMECLKAAFGSPVILDYLIEDMESQQKVLAGKTKIVRKIWIFSANTVENSRNRVLMILC